MGAHNQPINWQRLGSLIGKGDGAEYLAERGISLSLARQANLRSLTPEQTATIWSGVELEALAVPFARQVRPFGSVIKWLSAPGKSPSIAEAPIAGIDWEDARRAVEKDLLIIEGPIKALAAIANKKLAIGLSGCWNWQKDRQPLIGLRRYKWAGRTVTPVFDADITENNNVALPYLLLGDWLQAQGARVIHVQIPKIKGKHTGFDDFVAAKGIRAFDALPRHAWDSPAVEELRTTVMRTTEGGLSAFFILRHGGDLRFDSTEEMWYVWNGTLWIPQYTSRAPAVQERMKETVLSIIADGNRITNKERRKAMLKWGTQCDSKKAIRGAMDLASSDSRLQISLAQLDQDAWLLGTQNGVLDLRTGFLTKAGREQLVSRAVAVAFDPDATAKRWKRFVKEIMKGDPEMIAFLQRLVGYFLIGGNPERLIFFLYGIGRNGKSVFIETLLKLMGDYGAPAKSELIMKHRAERDSESAQPFMLTLRGKRYITASEVGEGMQLDAAVVKTLTGGDEMTVRGLHAKPVRFTVEGKFVIRCNHRPIIDGADQAIWDRVVEIPFDLRLGEGDQDTKLRDRLNDEMPGILNWALEGCLEYQRGGLQIPDKVKNQTNKYRMAMDTVTQWLDECTETNTKARSVSGFLYANYTQWCDRRSKRGVLVFPVSQLEFSKKLTERGYQKKESHGSTIWRGLQLRELP